LFAVSYRSIKPMINSMRLTFRRCGRGPRAFAACHLTLNRTRTAIGPADMIAEANADPSNR